MNEPQPSSTTGDDPLRAWYQTCVQVRWASLVAEPVRQHRTKQDCYVLQAIAEGSLTLESYKYRVELAAGQYAILPPSYGFVHCREAGVGPHWAVGFATLPLPGTLDLLAQAPLPLIATAASPAALRHSCEALCRASGDPSRSGLSGRLRARGELDGLLSEALIAWLDGASGAITASRPQPEWLQAAYQQIQADYMRPDFSLRSIAASIGISLTRLQHGFRDCYGIAPGTLARQLRLQRACHLLRSNPELAIADIAGRCGFISPAGFSTAFRRQVGLSPQRFRCG